MRRYHYKPADQANPRLRGWMIPAGLICVVGVLVSVATMSISPREKGRAVTRNVAAISATADVPESKDKAAHRLSNNVVRQSVERRFGHCGLVRRTCVVDGDTFWLEGIKVRIADIDTPEVSQPQCAEEKALGDRATDRLVALLNEGPFEIAPVGNRDEDQYGRKLRVLVRNGRSLGDQLVAEGLARTWTGRREPWC